MNKIDNSIVQLSASPQALSPPAGCGISSELLRHLGKPSRENDDQPIGLFMPEYLDAAGKSKLVNRNHVLRSGVRIAYTPEDHARWAGLFVEIERLAPKHDVRDVADGFAWMRSLGGAGRIPALDDMNPGIRKASGFELVPVMGLLSNDRFFKLLEESKFPVTLSVRRDDELGYTHFPDIFHDLAGHGTMFLNDRFCDFVKQIGALGWSFRGQRHLQQMVSLLYWYTIEFGLKREVAADGRQSLRVFGAGIISSVSETPASVSSLVTPDDSHRPIHRLPFDLKRVLLSHYEYKRPQELYFVIDEYEQLTNLFRNDLAGFIKDLAADLAAGREERIPQGQLLPHESAIAI